MMRAPFPWQADQWRQLQQAHAAGRMPHALLLHGNVGLGKHAFATALAQWLLCRSPGETACGECNACRQFAAGSSPDFVTVAPLEDKKTISVEQVRELIDTLSLTSHAGGFRAAVVAPADVMTPSAANALLKTLEEPPGKTVLMLVSARPARLPATVRSRCRLIRFAPPPAASALDWLRAQGGLDARAANEALSASHGSPVRALALATEGGLERRAAVIAAAREVAAGRRNPVEAAEAIVKEPLADTIGWLSGWAAGEIRAATLAGSDARRMLALLDRLYEAEKLRDTSANPQLLLESLLVPLAPLRAA